MKETVAQEEKEEEEVGIYTPFPFPFKKSWRTKNLHDEDLMRKELGKSFNDFIENGLLMNLNKSLEKQQME